MKVPPGTTLAGPNVERAAEALFNEIWNGFDAWELASDYQRETTYRWVTVVAYALEAFECNAFAGNEPIETFQPTTSTGEPNA